VTPFGPGVRLIPTSARRWFDPCQVERRPKRWTTRLPALSMPIDERPSFGLLLNTPSSRKVPFGLPAASAKSPLMPAAVVVGDSRRCIWLRVSRPGITPFESTGSSEYRPPGFGAVRTWITTGPWRVNSSRFS
jgi:hypothetical protein